MKKIEKARRDHADKKNGMDDEEEEDDEDDDDDSDYEYTGGDLAIYDSALDEVDELIYVRDAFERLN
jgi:hypothetical protein